MRLPVNMIVYVQHDFRADVDIAEMPPGRGVIRFDSKEGNGLEYYRSEDTSWQSEVGNGSEDQ